MTKYAVTGDLQFADQPRLSHLRDDGITSRLHDQVECFDWMLDVAEERGCEGLLALGDIYDQRNAVTSTVLDQAGRLFERASSMFPDEVHVLVGNHDTPLRTPNITSLRALSGHAHVWDEGGTWESLAFAPWMQDPDDYRSMIGALSKEKEARFLLSHVMVVGAVPAEIGKAHTDLRPKRWDRIFLGDIHEPLEFSDSKIQYVGAPMHHHFGDAGGERGFWILDTETGEYEFVENDVSPRFHIVRDRKSLESINERDFARVQVEDDEVGQSLEREAGKRTAHVESRAVVLEEAEVRLDVRTTQSHRDILSAYAKHCEIGEEQREPLVALGMEILEEVLG